MNLDELRTILIFEIQERREEGCRVADDEQALLQMISSAKEERALLEIWNVLSRIYPQDLAREEEPNQLEDIRRRSERSSAREKSQLSDVEISDKIHGGWLGRCIGCMLGKPVEGWTKEKIERYLMIAGSYPLSDFIPEVIPHPAGFDFDRGYYETGLRGRITHALRDDDIDYTVLNLMILERHGADFRTEDVGREWLDKLPYNRVYTAERAAYRNLINGIQPPDTATYLNPYREWIGAQIRADIWGYVCPGDPNQASDFAYRDSVLSHVKNGIYGEMFFSSLISAAFVQSDIERMIRSALSEIPRSSRLHRAIVDVMGWYRETQDWKELWSRVSEKYGHYHPVHTINNAAMIVLSLLVGEGEFEKSITTAVMCGMDTDCNGATLGSIIGVLKGASSIPAKWSSPLNDALDSAIPEIGRASISKLAERTARLARSISRRVHT